MSASWSRTSLPAFAPPACREVRPGKAPITSVPQRAEDHRNGAFESGAESEKDDNGCDAPRHSQHGQGGAAAVVLHCAVGFFQQYSLVMMILNYSWRNASTGSSMAALRAG